MATSDNVVRAGLTPKLRDVPTLIDMLTYEAGPAEAQLLQPSKFHSDDQNLLYDPPIDEFSVLRTRLDKGKQTKHVPIDGPSIAVVTQGAATVTFAGGKDELKVLKGDVFFVGAGAGLTIDAKEDTEIFRAFVEA